ncbi:hypothetical protein GOP47_0025698 [Adiantum capillus-veneris]|uniref:Uncharacterized protein n=1 Tax=Adiantum capillus-veneris TaxID=13818 RepID=A0A9D4Z366_ADICA|nr:hypothetical protein GOP47_0025698 [Adiantum capillus-veneris]
MYIADVPRAKERIIRYDRLSSTDERTYKLAIFSRRTSSSSERKHGWWPFFKKLPGYNAREGRKSTAGLVLEFSRNTTMPGSFLLSCENVRLTGTTIMQGSARRRDQSYVQFEVDLERNVANIEGRLLWLVNPMEPYDSTENDEAGFGTYDASDDPEVRDHANSLGRPRPKREVTITPPNKDDKQDIQNLVRLWDLDNMDRNLGQATLVEFPRRPRPNEYTPHRQGWRIDNQENGSFQRNNLQYYSLAVQNGAAVYASVLVPVRYRVGRTRIRNAFLQSMEQGEVVSIDLPPPAQRQPPPQDDVRAENVWVQSLSWVVLAGLVLMSL